MFRIRRENIAVAISTTLSRNIFPQNWRRLVIVICSGTIIVVVVITVGFITLRFSRLIGADITARIKKERGGACLL